MCQTLLSLTHTRVNSQVCVVLCSMTGRKGPNPGMPWSILSTAMKGTVAHPQLTLPECLRLLKKP